MARFRIDMAGTWEIHLSVIKPEIGGVKKKASG